MKYLILIFFISCSAEKKKCPSDLSSHMASCRKIECVQDQSKLIQSIFKIKHKFITEVSVKKDKNFCQVDFYSEWTGQQTCRYPRKYIEKIGPFLSKKEDRKGIKMYTTLLKMSVAQNLSELKQGMDKLQVLEDESLKKQMNIQKLHKENPAIAKNWNSMCELDESKADEKKLNYHKKMMSKMSDNIARLQLKVDKLFNDYSSN